MSEAQTLVAQLDRELGTIDDAMYDVCVREAGQSFLLNDDKNRAVEMWYKADEVGELDGIQRNLFGLCLGKLGRHEEALEQFLKMETAEPRSAVTFLNLGDTYYALGHLEDAQTHYEHSLELQPEFLAAKFRLGVVYGEQNMLEEATQVFSTSLQHDDDEFEKNKLTRSGVFLNIAHMYIEQESFTEAQEAIDAGLKLDSDNFSLHVVNVELAKKVGRYGRAVESMDFIMSSGPVTNFMYLPSVEFYFKAGCYDQAMDLADLGLQGPQKVECTRVKSSILEAQGKYKEAAECLEGYLSEGLSIRRSLFTEPRAAVMGAKLAYLWCLAGNKGRARIWSTKFSEILGRHYLEETESVVRESASAVVVASKPEPVVGRTTAAVMAADEKLYQARLRHLQSLEVYIKSLLTSRLYSKRSLRKLADNLADYTMKHGVEHADEFLDTCHIPKYLRGELSDYLTEREVISTTDFYTPGDGVGPMESGISVVTGLGGLGAFISTTESLTLFSALTTTVVSSGVGMYVAHLFRKHYGDRVVRRRKNKQLRKKTVNNMLRIHTRKYREVKLQLE